MTTVTPMSGGGITTPAGFRAAGIACGIKASGRKDLAIVTADRPVPAAGLFTTNRAKAAPVLLSQEQLGTTGGLAQGIVTNSGCANACTGSQGAADALEMAALTAKTVSYTHLRAHET